MRGIAAKRRISTADVAAADPLGYVAALMVGLVALCTTVMLVYTGATGRSPEESWSEIAIGVSLITLALFALLRYRASRISRLLETGERARASVDGHRVVDAWVWLEISYRHQGRGLTRRVYLPSSVRTRGLGELREVGVAFEDDHPRRVIVTDLYEPPEARAEARAATGGLRA